MSHTFKVDDVSGRYQSRDYRRFESERSDSSFKQFIKQGLSKVFVKGDTVEAFKANGTGNFISSSQANGFVETCIKAFNDHRPITFTPDEIWIVILQAFSKHIEFNAEEVRHALVPFEGKKELIVQADHLIKGDAANDWGIVFQGFSNQIETFLGKKRDLFDAKFSTTTPIERVAIQIQMMAALAPYFDYTCRTCCGVPTITVEGTVDDWMSIVLRVDAAREFYPVWAWEPLVAVVKEFADAAAGKPNIDFWKNFFKYEGGSGGPYVNGTINAFFPYIGERPNFLMKSKSGKSFHENIKSAYGGINVGDFPGSVGSVPMKWEYFGTNYKMRLAAGIFGTSADESGYRSIIGWAIGEDSAE